MDTKEWSEASYQLVDRGSGPRHPTRWTQGSIPPSGQEGVVRGIPPGGQEADEGVVHQVDTREYPTKWTGGSGPRHPPGVHEGVNRGIPQVDTRE